jgi:TRAP-type C4-dicarboxylate transport system substrate-binding protein
VLTGRTVAHVKGRPALLILAVATSLATLVGCSLGGSERVGGAPAVHVHELTMIDLFGPQEGVQFADEVSKLSKGELRIRLISDEYHGPDYEADVIRRMKDGEADLAIAGTRAWDDFGAPGLSALGAPFLVDSYALQARLFTSGLVDTVLDELRPAGFVGIGILPGPIRRPFGLIGALATPADFQGTTIGTQQSNVADATLRAFGANPRRLQQDVTSASGNPGLDGLEFQVSGIESGRLDAQGSHLMTNVDLWPRSLVVFAGESAYSQLSDDERQVLHTAATNVAPVMADTDRVLESESAANLCRKGHAEFDAASPQQLRALRRAAQPVYAELARDPRAKAVIDAVEHVKEQRAEPPTVISPCSPAPSASSGGAPTAVDGVWTMDTDRSAAVPEYFDENWGHWVFVFDRGRFAITQENRTSCTWGYGTYAVNGTRMSWTFIDGGGIAPDNATNRPGEYFVFDFSAYHDTLTLAAVPDQTSPLNFRAEPWRRASETPSSAHLSTRCPPPPRALHP